MTVLRTFSREARSMNHQHGTLLKELRSIGARAADIGRTLQRVKDGLPHGTFEQWIEGHLSFGPRQARRYLEFYGRVASLESPSQELLASEWREIQNPEPKRTFTSDLSDIERAELMRTEGAVEPEEMGQQPPAEWVPDIGEMNVGICQRDRVETTVILVHDPTLPGFVRVYLILDQDDGDNLLAFPRGVPVDALAQALAYLRIELAGIDWSGPGPLDGNFIGELQKMAA